MNAVRAIRYLGVSLFAGCSVGFLFTVVFMLLLSLSGVQALFALAFFGSFAVAGYFAVVFDCREKRKEVALQ